MSYGLHFHFYKDPTFHGLGLWKAFEKTRELRPELTWLTAIIPTLSNQLIVYKHVEMSVPRTALSERVIAKYWKPGTEEYARLCISVVTKLGVTVIPKTLSNENYQKTLELQVSYEQIQQIVEFAEMHEGAEFSHAWYQTFLCPMPSNGKSFFCVQFVVMNAQQAGLFEGLNPSAISGDVLLRILEKVYEAKAELRSAQMYNRQIM